GLMARTFPLTSCMRQAKTYSSNVQSVDLERRKNCSESLELKSAVGRDEDRAQADLVDDFFLVSIPLLNADRQKGGEVNYFRRRRRLLRPTRTVPPSWRMTASQRGTRPRRAGVVARAMTARARVRFCFTMRCVFFDLVKSQARRWRSSLRSTTSEAST